VGFWFVNLAPADAIAANRSPAIDGRSPTKTSGKALVATVAVTGTGGVPVVVVASDGGAVVWSEMKGA